MSLRDRPFRLTSWTWGEAITAAWVAVWIVAGFVLLFIDAFGMGWLGFVSWGIALVGAAILAVLVMPETSGDFDGAGAGSSGSIP